jgi:DinB superfamily
VTRQRRHYISNAIGRPGADEYHPAFADYVARIEDDEPVLRVLSDQRDAVLRRLDRIPEARGDYRYAPGKWSIKEVIGHLSDTERVFAYRALRIGRGDETPLPPFDDQSYVSEMRAADRSLASVAREWESVRSASLSLFESFQAPDWLRRGSASGHPISVRALACVIAGHVRHHLEVLDARYGD